MAYDDYYRPKRNQSHYDEPQDHYQNQHEGDYEEYISQEGYHHAPPQNLYSQNVYPHNSYSEQIHYSQSPQNEKYVPYTRDEHYPSYTQNPQYPSYFQDHQDYPHYSNHYENEEYMMQPYEEEITEDTKNKILAIMEEFKQDMANMREEWRQERRQRISSLGQETQASIRNLEDQMAQVAKYDYDVLESFTFDDESLSNELTNDLHEICGDDDVNIEASLCDLNDIECVTFHDNCFDDALYIHDLIGKDRSEGVKNENVKEEVEEKEEIRNESVREEVEEKCGNPGLFGIIVYDVKILS
ncbi:RNA polymerase II degradation factor 1-like [Ipomoea triloba]|uniref:RNA polymerase II degradation factor 1-like n=1 Tax=Ipomoea triloba TaxID=35885 RepID=UPI00125D0AB3|nr:RNA polymerase II degradation factor 1-like [Ipomoea triloba]